jgi:hypothetical protein
MEKCLWGSGTGFAAHGCVLKIMTTLNVCANIFFIIFTMGRFMNYFRDAYSTLGRMFYTRAAPGNPKPGIRNPAFFQPDRRIF